jgi:dUTP pyrophosphatase
MGGAVRGAAPRAGRVSPEVPVRRLAEDAVLPARTHVGDAGFDLASREHVVIGPGERALVGTGVAVAIPDGHAGLVVPRSGLAARHGIAVVNSPGLIDSGYRGEIRVIVLNTDRSSSFTIEPGMRIAQLLVVRVPEVALVEVVALTGSERGEAGFGSSGTR